MSVSVHAAIGYAMPWKTFYEMTLLPMDRKEYIGDEFDYHLELFNELVYPVDDELIAREMSDLVVVVGNGDNQDHVLFFPTVVLKHQWYRFNDDIDWAFLDSEQNPIQYMKRGLPRHERHYMDRNGVAMPECRTNYNDPELVCGIPPVLRWWLLHCGVFDLRGIAKLRPMRAIWWG